MGLFGFGKKKEEEKKSLLPDLDSKEKLNLPSKRDLPKVPEKTSDTETTALPSLPESEKKFNRETIKHAINEPPQEMQKSKFAPLAPIKAEPMKKKENPSKIPEIRSKSSKKQGFSKPLVRKAEPIYVRLDKFNTTAESFEEIKNKVLEIENILKRTKEIRQKEEQELGEWEREIQIIKTRINSIDRDIFKELD